VKCIGSVHLGKNDPGNTVILYQLSLPISGCYLELQFLMVNPPIIFTILVDIPELLLVESLAGKSPELKKSGS
jgi:hypothetical protein